MNLAESAADYLRRQPALAESVGRLDAHLLRCDEQLHPAAPKAPDPARARRRRPEAGLSNHLPAKAPTGRIARSITELLTKAKEATATAEGRYTTNTNLQ